MRTIPAALTDAQKYAPFIFPKVRVRIFNRRGAARLLAWDRYYTGEEPAGPHATCCPEDGSLNRFRIDPATHTLYRQRVLDPDSESDYTSWTSVGVTATSLTCLTYGAVITLYYVAYTSPYHVWGTQSTDNGATWTSPNDFGWISDATGVIAAAPSPAPAYCVMYTRGSTLYARKWVSGAWGNELTAPYTFNSISGLSLIFSTDWDFIITGVNSSAEDGMFAGVQGNGAKVALDSWGTLKDIILRESTDPFEYTAPSFHRLETNRVYFVERHTDPTTQNRVYWTFQPQTESVISETWREPIPFDLETLYGIALTHNGYDAWLTTPDGVWWADWQGTSWDISSHVLEVRQSLIPGSFRSRLDVILNNTAGLYNDFAKLGHEIVVGLGYECAGGPLYSDTPSFYITGWRHVSPPWFPLRAIYPQGIIGTLHIQAEDIWNLLKRWRPRRTIAWAEGEKNVFLILEYLFARIGFDFTSTGGHSPALTALEPAFSITPGRNGRWAVKKLLSWVEDVVFQRQNSMYITWPKADDESVYTYHHAFGPDHLVYRGRYDTGAWDPNRAQVWGDTFMVEDFEFDQIEQVDDRLSRVATPDYPNVARGDERVAAELRKGQMWKQHSGWFQVPTNCSQEPWDVVKITDVPAGITNENRRIIAIETRYKKLAWLYWQVMKLGAV